METLVRNFLVAIEEGVVLERRGEAHREEELAPRRPAARLAKAGERAVGAKVEARPEDLAGIVIERRAEIEEQMCLLARGEAVAMDADARPRGEFGADAGISKGHGIIAGARPFGVVAEALAIARAGLFGIAGIQLHLSNLRHDEDVAEVRMARARKMRVAETLDRRVVVAVARGMIVAVADLARRVGVGRQLDHAEGRRRAGEGVAFGAGADHRIDEGERIGRRLLGEGLDRHKGEQRGGGGQAFHRALVPRRHRPVQRRGARPAHAATPTASIASAIAPSGPAIVPSSGAMT